MADGKSLYISAVIYDSTESGIFDENKYVGAWNGDNDDPPEIVIPELNKYAVSGGRLTITIPFEQLQLVTAVWDEGTTITPQNLQICELALFGMNAPGYEPDNATRDAHRLDLHHSDGSQGGLMYADKAGSIIGGNVNIHLQAGWNFVFFDNADNGKEGSADGFRWRFPNPDDWN